MITTDTSPACYAIIQGKCQHCVNWKGVIAVKTSGIATGLMVDCDPVNQGLGCQYKTLEQYEAEMAGKYQECPEGCQCEWCVMGRGLFPEEVEA